MPFDYVFHRFYDLPSTVQELRGTCTTVRNAIQEAYLDASVLMSYWMQWVGNNAWRVDLLVVKDKIYTVSQELPLLEDVLTKT